MKKYEFKVAWCDFCKQGWIEIVKNIDSGHLYLQCSECFKEFEYFEEYESAVLNKLDTKDTEVAWCDFCGGDWINRTENSNELYCPNCSRTWNSIEVLEEALFINYCENNNELIYCDICREDGVQLIKEDESYFIQCKKCNTTWINYEVFNHRSEELNEVFMEEEQIDSDEDYDYPAIKPTIDEIKKVGWDKYIISSF